AVGPAGYLFTIDPQTNLAAQRTHVVVVPLAGALAQVLPREAARPVGRDWWKWGHPRRADREDIAIGGEPVGLLPVLSFVLLPKAMIEDLHFDAALGERAGLEPLQRLLGGPDKDSRVPTRAEMPPLDHQLEIAERLAGARHAHRLPGAVDHAAIKAPGVGSTVDVDEIGLAERLPSR